MRAKQGVRLAGCMQGEVEKRIIPAGRYIEAQNLYCDDRLTYAARYIEALLPALYPKDDLHGKGESRGTPIRSGSCKHRCHCTVHTPPQEGKGMCAYEGVRWARACVRPVCRRSQCATVLLQI